MPSRTHMLAGLPTGPAKPRGAYLYIVKSGICRFSKPSIFGPGARQGSVIGHVGEATAVPGREPLAVALYDFISKLIRPV